MQPKMAVLVLVTRFTDARLLPLHSGRTLFAAMVIGPAMAESIGCEAAHWAAPGSLSHISDTAGLTLGGLSCSPLVPPQVSHLRQVPLRRSVKLPHSRQLSPS